MTPQEFFDNIAPLIGFLAFGGFVLIGLKMWLSYRTARLGHGGSEQMDRLTEAVERLREQVQLNREETAELHERLDFAERLLVRGKAEQVGKLERPLRE